jgi:hypothetical protein
VSAGRESAAVRNQGQRRFMTKAILNGVKGGVGPRAVPTAVRAHIGPMDPSERTDCSPLLVRSGEGESWVALTE